MIRIGDLSINPAWVASTNIDRRHYMNGPGRSVLEIRMYDGHVHRIEDTSQYLDGVDIYAVEKNIADAIRARTPTLEEQADG